MFNFVLGLNGCFRFGTTTAAATLTHEWEQMEGPESRDQSAPIAEGERASAAET